MDVAVIGGGLFGITTALSLSEAGFEVDLYEQADDIMTASSSTNQLRLHRGYHYPRSPSTARSCMRGAQAFTERYPEAVIEGGDHYYCIAADDRTKTTAEEFLGFCDDIGLNYEENQPEVVKRDKIDISVKVPENRIDPHVLRDICTQELDESNVEVHLGERVNELDNLSHDYIVVATYASINTLLEDYDSLRERYKFELCEKPVVRLPNQFSDMSVVILDGPFMCFDPYGTTGKFLLGNVVHAVHETTVGDEPAFSERYANLLNSGVIENPDITKFGQFIESGTEFIPGLANAEYIGSMYTTRTVLAGVEDTDERPTIVEREGNVFKIFSGKLGSCVSAAQKVRAALISETAEL